jgi:hypothetical protein
MLNQVYLIAKLKKAKDKQFTLSKPKIDAILLMGTQEVLKMSSKLSLKKLARHTETPGQRNHRPWFGHFWLRQPS